MRHQHQLRPLMESESGRKLQELPNGIYGFARCGESVQANPSSISSIEAQKRLDGIAYYVGYASEEDIKKYLTRAKKFHIRLFPRSGQNASSVFEIPIYFVARCESRSTRDSTYFDLFVREIPKLH